MLSQEQQEAHLLNDKDFAKNIEFERILLNNTDECTITFLCKVKNDPNDAEGKNKAILILNKPAFKAEYFKDFIQNKGEMCRSRLYFHNTIYHKFWLDFDR